MSLPIYTYKYDELEAMSDYDVRNLLYRVIEQRCVERSLKGCCEFTEDESVYDALDEFIVKDYELGAFYEREAIGVMYDGLYDGCDVPGDVMTAIDYMSHHNKE